MKLINKSGKGEICYELQKPRGLLRVKYRLDLVKCKSYYFHIGFNNNINKNFKKYTNIWSGPPGDLDDNKKRWLVVGICLHSILAPALRKYVEPIVTNLYNSLKISDHIDLQTYQGHLQTYGTANIHLNYYPINNNKASRGYRTYDYKVQNAVDLSKLFLKTHMANYTAFDESCDSSALLGMIVNIDIFPVNVQRDAEDVRICIYYYCTFVNSFIFILFWIWKTHKVEVQWFNTKTTI